MLRFSRSGQTAICDRLPGRSHALIVIDKVAYAERRRDNLSLWLLGISVYIRCMVLRILAAITFISFCLMLAMLTLTSPASVGLPGMLAIFILGYLSLLGIVAFLLYFGFKIYRLITDRFVKVSIRPTFSLARAYLYASVIAALPMIAIGLYSTDGIRWYEMLLLVIFGALGLVYVRRRL